MKRLLEFQRKIEAIVKDKTNPFYKSKYFDINTLLEVVKPILSELNLVLLQPLVFTQQEKPALKTLIVDSEDGKVIIDSMIPMIEANDPQKMGATITYYRRYAIQSLLCLQAEDEDGNTKSKGKNKTTTVAEILSKIRLFKTKEDIEKCEKWLEKTEYSQPQKNVILRTLEEVKKELNI